MQVTGQDGIIQPQKEILYQTPHYRIEKESYFFARNLKVH